MNTPGGSASISVTCVACGVRQRQRQSRIWEQRSPPWDLHPLKATHISIRQTSGLDCTVHARWSFAIISSAGLLTRELGMRRAREGGFGRRNWKRVGREWGRRRRMRRRRINLPPSLAPPRSH